MRAEFRGSAPDAGNIPGVLGTQNVLNGVSMAVGMMEMALYSSYTPPDLVHWGDSVPVIQPVPYHWDQMKIRPGATPIKTPRGWLNIYHGVFPTMGGAVYRLGVALHDLVDPAKVLGVADEWILSPEDPWEPTGYVHNVVFTCGAIAEDDGTLKIYWEVQTV